MNDSEIKRCAVGMTRVKSRSRYERWKKDITKQQKLLLPFRFFSWDSCKLLSIVTQESGHCMVFFSKCGRERQVGDLWMVIVTDIYQEMTIMVPVCDDLLSYP